MKLRILFTGGGGAGTESLWNNLSDKYELFFADACRESIDDLVPMSNKIEIPFASSPSFVSALKVVIKDKNIDVLVPGVDEELALIAKNKEQLQVQVLLPQASFIESMLDKFHCINIMKEKGLSVPTTLLSKHCTDIGFPQILKPRSGRGSRGVAIVNSIEEVSAYKIFHRVEQDAIISQQLVIGTEYTVLIAADTEGLLKAIIPVRVEQKKGITIRATAEFEKHIVEYCKLFHAAFKATGIYNLQCILTESGDVLPFEINPRVSTTFCLGIASGFDPFKVIFDSNNSQEVFYPKNKYVLKRNWHNSIIKVE